MLDDIETVIGVTKMPNDLYLRSCEDTALRSFLAPNYYRWLEVDIYVAKDSVLQKHSNLEALPSAIPLGPDPNERFDPNPRPRGKVVKALNNKKDNWAHVLRRWKSFTSEKFQAKFIAAVKYNIMYAKIGKHDNFYKAVLECNDFINEGTELKERLVLCSKARSLSEMAQALGIVETPNIESFKLQDSFFSSHILRKKDEIISEFKTVAGYWHDLLSEDLKAFDFDSVQPIQHRELPLKGACEGWDLYLKLSANKRAHSLFGNIDVSVTEYNPDSVPTLRSVIDKIRTFNVGVPAADIELFISKCYPNLRQYRFFGALEPTSQIRGSDTNAVPWWRNGNGQQLTVTYWNTNTVGGGVGGSSNPKLYCLLTRRIPSTSTSLLLANINESWTPLLAAEGGPVRNYAVLNPVLGLPLSLGLVYTSVVTQPLPCSLENWFYRSLYYLQSRLFFEGFLDGTWVYPSQTCLGYPVETGIVQTWGGVTAVKNINGGNSGGANDPYYGAVKNIKLFTFDPNQVGITNFWVFPSQLYEKFGYNGLVMFLCMLHDFPLLSYGVDGCITTNSHTSNVASVNPNGYTLLSALGIQPRVAATINVLVPTNNAAIPATTALAVAASSVPLPNAYTGAFYSTATPAVYDATAMLNASVNLITADIWTAWIEYLAQAYGAGSDLQSALYMFSQIACRPILDQCKHEDHCNTPWLDPQWDNNVTISAHKFNNGRVITGSRHHLHNSGNIESSATAFKPTYLLDVPVMAWNALALKMAVRSVKRDANLVVFPRTAPDLYAYLDYCSMTQRVAYWTFYKTIGTAANTWAVNNYDLEPALYDPTTTMTDYQKLILKIHQAILDWVPPHAIDGTNCLYRYHLDTYHTSENNTNTAYYPASGMQANWTLQPFDCGVKMSIRYSELAVVLKKFYLLNCLPQRQYVMPKLKWVIDRPDYPGQQDVTGVLQGLFSNSIPLTLKSFNSAAFPQVSNEYFQESMTYNSMIGARLDAFGTWGDARNIQLAANSNIYLPAPFEWALNGWAGQTAHFSTGVDYGQYSMKEIINMAFYVSYNAFLTLMVPRTILPAYNVVKNGVVEQRNFWYIQGYSMDGMGYLIVPQTNQLAGLLELGESDTSDKSSSDVKLPNHDKADDKPLSAGDEHLKV